MTTRPTRFAVFSDAHVDAVTAGVRRFEELAAHLLGDFLPRVTADAGERVDAVFFLGDWCDPNSDAGSLVQHVGLAVFIADRLRAAGIPSFWLAGNHDVVETRGPVTTLSALRGVEGATIFEEPGMRIVAGVEVVALPYTAPAHVYDPRDAVRSLVGSGDEPLVVLSHLNVRGLIPGEESIEMARGREVWFPDEEVAKVAAKRPTLVLSGHHHERQEHRTPSGLPVHVVGALGRFRHGSGESREPGYVVVGVR